MMKKENNKGITLIALVITIIVMLILVVVTINVATDGGLIKKAKIAADQTKKAADLEELEIENAAQAADGDAFIVELADKFGNKYKYYRLDKVTEEQREKCRENGIPMLMGDGNLDGKIDEQDFQALQDYLQDETNEFKEILFDFDGMPNVTLDDLAMANLMGIYEGKINYRSFAINGEINNDYTGEEPNIIENEENGKLYFIEEKVSEEEAKELEKYGVNRTMLGDLNLDGKLTQEDTTILSKKVDGSQVLNKLQEILADMNEDGNITAVDTTVLMSKVK